MTDPFHITGPAVISVSGGRTSGLMLRRILDAHDGRLPDDVVAIFTNTGREMPATLDFIQAMSVHWEVAITWLEFRRDVETGHRWAEVVSHNSAARDGEPFDAMLAIKPMLPNPVMRFCTLELKIKTMARYVRQVLGWEHWATVVGLRADEPGRVGKALARAAAHKGRFSSTCPLSDAGVIEADVLQFWREQPFDLGLRGSWEGNCDGCFLKGRGAITRMLRDHPERMAWWAATETRMRGRTLKPDTALFRADRESYTALTRLVGDQGVLPFNVFDDRLECQWACTD